MWFMFHNLCMLLKQDPQGKVRQEAKSIDVSKRLALTNCNDTMG